MVLPIAPPFAPMEALSVPELPADDGWQFEPKWDGFRCLVFRDGDEVDLRSKAGQPLGRYFPEIVALARAVRAVRFVLDGELLVPVDGTPSFGALLQRIHPADSRVRRLASATPAILVAFDLIVDERGRSLVARPLAERRRRLEAFAARFPRGNALRLSPATRDHAVAQGWLDRLGADLDGIVAKRLDGAYESGERAMRKIKRVRTADCVVGGWRASAKTGEVASLLLGLYGDDGLLHHVGHTSTMPAALRGELTRTLRALAGEPGFTGRAPGGPSRWARGRETAWNPVRPTLVVEVAFDHASEERFRHGATFTRLRPDKAPRQCRMEQLDAAVATAR